MTSHRPLVRALILSSAIHAVWLVDTDWSWPFSRASEDEVLEKKKPEKVKRVRLALSGPATDPVIPTVSLLGNLSDGQGHSHEPSAAAPPPARPEPARHHHPRPVSTTTDTAAATAVPVQPLSEPPREEPPPSFPISVTALHRASYYGFQMDLRQQWLMEGYQYVISNDARKFGFTAKLTSEGKVTPEGLQPEHYRLMLNGKLQQYADFDRVNGVVVHGKAGSQHVAPITPDFQDMASLPYHVAVSYEGEGEKRLKVTTGSSVYDVLLKVDAEETLKLPGGTLRTLHLTGSRVRDDGTQQSGYDIWLAPDLRNYPVKFRGPDSKGKLLEMSVLSLSFDDKPVFGKENVPALPEEANGEVLPESLRQQHDLPDTPVTPAAAAEPAAPASGPSGGTPAEEPATSPE